jgi:hypothetical protein
VSEPNPVGSPAVQPGGADRRRHSYLVNDLKVDNRHPEAPVVATELVGSNAGGYEPFARYLRDNPHIRSFDNRTAATPAARSSASAGTSTCGWSTP